jgi:hypothetical protein
MGSGGLVVDAMSIGCLGVDRRGTIFSYFKVSHFSFHPRCVCFISAGLLQTCSCGGGEGVEDMYYERRRTEACVDESAHHTLVNTGGREIV